MKIVAWYSRSEDVAVAMDPVTAQHIVNNLAAEAGKGRIHDPAVVMFRNQLEGALRDVPPEKR